MLYSELNTKNVKPVRIFVEQHVHKNIVGELKIRDILLFAFNSFQV